MGNAYIFLTIAWHKQEILEIFLEHKSTALWLLNAIEQQACFLLPKVQVGQWSHRQSFAVCTPYFVVVEWVIPVNKKGQDLTITVCKDIEDNCQDIFMSHCPSIGLKKNSHPLLEKMHINDNLVHCTRRSSKLCSGYHSHSCKIFYFLAYTKLAP